jgi:hypothetical protein
VHLFEKQFPIHRKENQLKQQSSCKKNNMKTMSPTIFHPVAIALLQVREKLSSDDNSLVKDVHKCSFQRNNCGLELMSAQ